MEVYKHIMNSNSLDGIIPLPRPFQNRKVEIVVSLIDEETRTPLMSKEEIDSMLNGSITESLIGILPNSSRNLEEYQSERLQKYERSD